MQYNLRLSYILEIVSRPNQLVIRFITHYFLMCYYVVWDCGGKWVMHSYIYLLGSIHPSCKCRSILIQLHPLTELISISFPFCPSGDYVPPI